MTQLGTSGRPQIAYITSRFPKLSETFILYEMIEMEKLGAEIDVFALVQEQEKTIHPEAARFTQDAYYGKLSSIKIWQAQLYWLIRNPLLYFSIFFKTIWGNRTSLPYLMRALLVFPAAVWFAKQMVEAKIDHIHAHWATHSALAAWIASRLAKIPYSFTAHANDIYVDQTMLATKIKDAKFTATISNFNVEFLREKGVISAADSLEIVHCGVDTEFFSRREEAGRTEVERSNFVITCVGRLVQKKGQTFLIEACKRLKEAGISFECRFVGDGEMMEALQEKVRRYQLESEVHFLGKRTRDEVLENLLGSDVMVLPSITTSSGRMEGIPVVLMEAMALGLPVISTRISGIPELVRHEENGILIAEQNVEQLTSGLIQIYENRDWAQGLGQNGRRLIQEEFDLGKNCEKLFGLIFDKDPNYPKSRSQTASSSEGLLSNNGYGVQTMTTRIDPIKQPVN